MVKEGLGEGEEGGYNEVVNGYKEMVDYVEDMLEEESMGDYEGMWKGSVWVDEVGGLKDLEDRMRSVNVNV